MKRSTVELLMANIPKIIRSRLAQKAAEKFAVHPDPNLLAAFGEHTLPPREHAEVSAHLAGCADCREYFAVAFATAEPERAAVAASPADIPRRQWFPAWRWAASAAAIGCVTAALWQLRVKQSSPVITNPTASVSETRSTQPEPPPPAVAEMKKLQPRAFAKKREPQLLAANKSSARLVDVEPAPTPSAIAQQNPMVALLPPSRQAAAPAPMVRQAAVQDALWSINASPDASLHSYGEIQKSLDGGQTWQTVRLSNDVSFRAIAAVGPHVWAGGSNGALFQSSDGGSHWNRITVAEQDTKLTGAIVSIDAQSEDQLKITSSSGEKWISANGGRDWKRE